MKSRKSFILLLSVIMAVFSVQSCDKTDTEQTGSLDFGMTPIIENALKSLANYHYEVEAALVSIVDENGVKVYDKEYIEFYSFGETFVTKSLKLNVGAYKLSEFMLVDSLRNIIWATPTEGSRLAYMVNDPLPMLFEVYADNTTHLFPQVVKVANHNPDDFGYLSFHVDFVDDFCIGVFFESLCNEWYSDSLPIMANGITAPFFASRMLIYSEGQLLSETYLYPGENKVLIPRGHDMYRIMVSDCGNQTCFNEVFGMAELRHFSCTEGEFLIINCEPTIPDIIITPENIQKPTIDQGVFGKITQPLWDSTILYQEYLIQPFVTDIYIYKAEPGDTLYYPMPATDCYVYPDIQMEPLAIVRTNSMGFYQLPLEKGTYNYMVRSLYGYYIDMRISSHYPGEFKVTSGEVTILNIHVEPCVYY